MQRLYLLQANQPLIDKKESVRKLESTLTSKNITSVKKLGQFLLKLN